MSTVEDVDISEVTDRDIGRVLEICRHELGLGVHEAAEKIGGFGGTSLHRYERGERTMPMGAQLAACRFYGLSLFELWSRAAAMRVWLNPHLAISLVV